MDTQNQLSPITRALHWIVALIFIGLWAVGFYMATFEVWGLFDLHKALGVIAFLIIAPRVLWRMKTGWPTPVRDYPLWEHRLSIATHWALILGTLIMPISGFIFSAASGHGVDVFGLILVPTNPDPSDITKVIPFNEAITDICHETHEIVGNLMAVVIGLHVVGALKHHLIDKDRTLLRMLGK